MPHTPDVSTLTPDEWQKIAETLRTTASVHVRIGGVCARLEATEIDGVHVDRELLDAEERVTDALSVSHPGQLDRFTPEMITDIAHEVVDAGGMSSSDFYRLLDEHVEKLGDGEDQDEDTEAEDAVQS